MRATDDGGRVLADLGVLDGTEAARVAAAVTAAGLADLTSVAVGAM